MKKPLLSVVDGSTPNRLAPHATLGKAGAKLWQTLLADFAIEDSGGLQMLLQICSAADALSSDSEIEADGPKAVSASIPC